MVVGAGGLSRRAVYTLWFELQNQPTPHTSPSVNVSAMIRAGAHFSPLLTSVLAVRNDAALGVPSGANPLFIVEPLLLTRAIVQASPLASAMNKIVVTMVSSCDLGRGSRVTLTNLIGTQTTDSASLNVWSFPEGALSTSAIWSRAAGTLEVTVGSATIHADTAFTVQFELRNRADSQLAPVVNVSGVVEAGLHDSPIAMVALEAQRGALLGLPDGDSPLYTVVPQLVMRQIQQSSPFASARNNITVSLRTNCDFAPGSTVTLTNLVGTQTADTASLLVWSSPQAVLGGVGSWTKVNGTLAFTVGPDALMSNTTYRVWFQLRNLPTAQAAASVSAWATVEAGVLDSPVEAAAVEPVSTSVLGVLFGSNPLLIIVPEFSTKIIG
jgi:hypothetical protein